MKTNKFFLIVLAVLSLAIPARAQLGTDLFGAPRAINFIPMQNLLAGASLVTNTVDLVNFNGNAALFLFSNTNGAGGGTLTATLYSSNDKTNFTAVSTYALATASTIVTTNRYYGGTNLTSSSSYLLPGVTVIPTASSSGWATPYLAPALYTNSAAVTLSNPSTVLIGLPTGDIGRYLHIVYTVGGSATNYTVGGVIHGSIHSSQLQ